MSELTPVPHTTIPELIDEIRQYRPADVLVKLDDWSRRIPSWKPLDVRLPRHLDPAGSERTLTIAPHMLALIGRLSLLKGHGLAPGSLSEDSCLRLLRIVCELYEPTKDWRTVFFRTVYEQAQYQEQEWQAIPRALLLYLDANRSVVSPRFDIDKEFKTRFRLSIEEFLSLGFAFYIQLRQERRFYPLVGWRAEREPLKSLLTKEKIVSFLQLVGADQRRFQNETRRLSTSGSGEAQYDFNTFSKYPLIDLASGNYVAPLPQLLIWRLYYAPFHELSDAFRDEGGANEFRAFFGEVFQQYVGLLLRHSFPPEDVFPELGPAHPGPVDWVLRVGTSVILVECRSSELTLEAKSTGDATAIGADLDRIAVQTVQRLFTKVDALSRAPGTHQLSGAKRWHSLVVVREPLLPVPLVRDLIDAAIGEVRTYHLLSVAEFEYLLGFYQRQGIDELLVEKESSPEEIRKDFRTFLFERRDERGQLPRNSLLNATFDRYFAGLISDA